MKKNKNFHNASLEEKKNFKLLSKNDERLEFFRTIYQCARGERERMFVDRREVLILIKEEEAENFEEKMNIKKFC